MSAKSGFGYTVASDGMQYSGLNKARGRIKVLPEQKFACVFQPTFTGGYSLTSRTSILKSGGNYAPTKPNVRNMSAKSLGGYNVRPTSVASSVIDRLPYQCEPRWSRRASSIHPLKCLWRRLICSVAVMNMHVINLDKCKVVYCYVKLMDQLMEVSSRYQQQWRMLLPTTYSSTSICFYLVFKYEMCIYPLRLVLIIKNVIYDSTHSSVYVTS